MINLKQFEVWFVTGSQHLYGPETLKAVAKHSQEITAAFNAASAMPVKFAFKPVMGTTPENLTVLCQEANSTPQCIGLITHKSLSPFLIANESRVVLLKPIIHAKMKKNGDLKLLPTCFASDCIRPKIVVVMPFNKEFDDVYCAMVWALRKTRLPFVRVDQIPASTRISLDIEDRIERCNAVIADITGNNPNVLFEAGLACGRKKPVIIITQSVKSMPIDLLDRRAIPYENSWSGIQKLRRNLVSYLLQFCPSDQQALAA
jgi:hypothetical protein